MYKLIAVQKRSLLISQRTMQSFQVNIKEYLFQKPKQINLLSQKRTSTSLLWKHFSKTWTCSQQNGLVFSRLDFSLLHWLCAHHIQVSAQIFYAECRLFCLFQNVSPPQKVLYLKYSICKPHANNLIKITLSSQEIIQVGSNETNKFRKPQQGRREQQYYLHSWSSQNYQFLSENVKQLSKKHTSAI